VSASRRRPGSFPSPDHFRRKEPHEVPSAARPRRRPPHRGRREDQGRHHHPDTAKEKPQEGEVVAVGPGARDESGKLVALDVKAGDRVLFGKWSGTEVKIDGRIS
jgi:hypothetical protein